MLLYLSYAHTLIIFDCIIELECKIASAELGLCHDLYYLKIWGFNYFSFPFWNRWALHGCLQPNRSYISCNWGWRWQRVSLENWTRRLGVWAPRLVIREQLHTLRTLLSIIIHFSAFVWTQFYLRSLAPKLVNYGFIRFNVHFSPIQLLEHYSAGHKDSVSSLAFSTDGQLLASGSLDGIIQIWDITSQNLKCTLEGPGGGIEVKLLSCIFTAILL